MIKAKILKKIFLFTITPVALNASLALCACGSQTVKKETSGDVVTPEEKLKRNLTQSSFWGDGSLIKDGYYDNLAKGSALKRALGSIGDYDYSKKEWTSAEILPRQYSENLVMGSTAGIEDSFYLQDSLNQYDYFWYKSKYGIYKWYEKVKNVYFEPYLSEKGLFTRITLLHQFNQTIEDDDIAPVKSLLTGGAFSDDYPLDAAALILFGWPTGSVPTVKFSNFIENSFSGVRNAFEALGRAGFRGYLPNNDKTDLGHYSDLSWERAAGDEKYFDDSAEPLLAKGEKRRYTVDFVRDPDLKETWMQNYEDASKSGGRIRISIYFQG